jgi:4-amino-4-deoxy-L-arabinose transferase-like glycosyltransferase
MTIDLFFTAILVVSILVALDVLFLLARQRQKATKLTFADIYARTVLRAREWISGLKPSFSQQQTKPPVSLPVVIEENRPAEIIAPVLPAGVAPAPVEIQETEISMTPASENDTQASGSPVRVHITAEVPVGSVVHITITAGTDGTPIIHQKPDNHEKSQIKTPLPSWHPAWQFPQLSITKNLLNGFKGVLSKVLSTTPERLNTTLFILALLLYLATRFTGLADFPIYFFGDEAVQTVSAAELVSHGWKSPDGQLLPTYFQNGTYFNLSTSVYAQVLPYLLFGKSVLVTRGTSVLITLLAALAVGLILRDAFKVRRWWLGTLLLSITPAWFLHSRTAFETAIFVSFYAAFVYFYFLYRLKDSKYVYHATVLAALAFYSYSPGQLVLATTAMFLFLSDIKYHWQNRGILLRAIAVLVVLALPYLRFRMTQSYSPFDHLRQLDSYWIHPISLNEKLYSYASAYLYGLSPQYWFFPDATKDLSRHVMKGYGNISLWTLPLFLLGVILTVRKIRGSEYRAILLVLLAAPTGAALAEIGITRVLVFVIPASILSVLGLDLLLNWLEDTIQTRNPRLRSGILKTFTSLALFVILAGLNVSMLNDALTNGPTWFQDYGLYGMQYGARQIFEQTVLPKLKEDPKAYFVISPSWANGAEEFASFFIPPEYQARIMLALVDNNLIAKKPPLGTDTYFIVTADDYENIISDPKFLNVVKRSIINLPTGKPGFYIINLAFAKNIDELMAQQEASLRTPVEDSFQWNNQTVRVIHSPFTGQLNDLMDGRPDTLAKTLEANPFILDYYFKTPIPTSSVSIQTGSMPDFTITIKLYAPGSGQPVEYSQNFKGLPPDPMATILFPNGPAQADHIYIEIKGNTFGDTAQIHVREITFK